MMREVEYAYAVARVRANELNLLSAADVELVVLNFLSFKSGNNQD